MRETGEVWQPGSFTKNYGWGDRPDGLRLLHRTLQVGFGGEETDVPRDLFRERLRLEGLIEYIPVNFFLFNRTVGGIDFIIFDELGFQATKAAHSRSFDKLALFAFNFTYAGRWAKAAPSQKRPALWAFHYIHDRVSSAFNWNTSLVNADDIEHFVQSDPRYTARTARKLATNLNYLYEIGHLSEFARPTVERWWVDALFLAMDRLIEDRRLDRLDTAESQYASLLEQSGFHAISGARSLEKDLATKHLLTLYRECGSRARFSPEAVRERTSLRLPDLVAYIANDDRAQGAIHRTNPRILKSIPRACAMLAKYAAGFEVIDADELENFDAQEFIRRQTRSALQQLRDQGISPSLSAEDLMRMTRGR